MSRFSPRGGARVGIPQQKDIFMPHPNRIVAAALALLSLLSIFAMLHHPSVSASHVNEQIAEMNHEAKLNALIHGTLIAFTIAISLCLCVYAQLRRFSRITILFGIICYWLGTLAMITAAIINGFVAAHLASQYIGASTEQLAIYQGVSRLAWLLNQYFAEFGAIAWCAAMIWWGVDMLKQSKPIKVIGMISMTAATAIIVAMLTSSLSLSVSGMTMVLIIISLWHLVIATLIYRYRDDNA